MDEYKKSNYAINKVRKGIVYKNADGSILEVTFEKIAKDNPGFTQEDFEKLKHLSDELYHEEAKSDWNYHYHITSDLDENFINKWIASSSLEDDIMARDGKKIFNEQLQEAVDTLLTPTQRRRFRLFAFKRLTYRDIAKSENADLRAVWESIEQSKKKIQKFLKKHSTNSLFFHI